jgi:hypothetical protein
MCTQQAFSECRRVLQPDGLFLGSVFGGESLFQLRRACHTAEEERCGGVSQRFSPLMHVRSHLPALKEKKKKNRKAMVVLQLTRVCAWRITVVFCSLKNPE